MKIQLDNKETILLREFQEKDFEAINELNKKEEWNNLVAKKDDTKSAWMNSNVAFVATTNNSIIGYCRGLTDGTISLYICELLIDQSFRGLGLGQKIIFEIHRLYPKTRMELLASTTSQSFYESQNYRAFYGFRKTFEEYDINAKKDS
jgi:ribosomal protein S18 acetylase RimI-like enzyme